MKQAAGAKGWESRGLEIIDDGDAFSCVFRPKMRGWVQACGMIAAVGTITSLPAVAGVAHQVDASGWTIARAALLGGGVLTMVIAGIAFLTYMSLSAIAIKLSIADGALFIRDEMKSFRIPLADVLRVRARVRRRRGLHVYPYASPRNFFGIAPAGALYIRTTNGLLRVLRIPEMEDLFAIAEHLRARVPDRMARGDRRSNDAAKRYRVQHRAVRNDPLASETIVTWTEPQAVAELKLREASSAAVVMFVRTCTVTVAGLLLCRLAIEPYLPDFPWTKVIWLCSLLPAMPFGGLAAMLMWQRTRPAIVGGYALTNDGVVVPSREHPLKRWTWLDSFTIGEVDRMPEAAELRLHSKGGTTRALPLPLDADAAAEIVGQVNAGLPHRPPLPQHRPLSARDWTIGFAFTIAFCACAAMFIASRMHILRGHGSELQLAFLLLGPGTFVALALRKRRAAPALFHLAGSLNLLAMLATMTIAVLRRLMIT